MADEEGSLTAQFRNVTGCTDAVEAAQYLEMCGGNLELAVNLYYQHFQPTSSSLANGDQSPEVVYANYSGRRNAGVTRRASGTAPHSNIPESSSGDVRAPIAPVRGAIVEQTFAQQYNAQNGRITSSVFDTARNFQAEAEERLAMLRNGQGASDQTAVKRMTLQALFRPPVDIMFNGDWEAVRAEAQQRRHWLLVNVQDDREFACQALNRDVWSNSSVKEIIRSNFVFWQVHKDWADGNRMRNYYRIESFPAIFVVDPRTGELLTTIRAKDAVSFCDQLTSFLDSSPDFETRDRQLTAMPAFSTSEQSTSKQNNGSDVYVENSPTTSSQRKRVHSSDDVMDDGNSAGSSAKKLREGGVKADIDSIIDSGSKLTTVDQDEWLKWVGTPDGRGCRLALLLRLPDGSRQLVEVEDTTTLKALFILVAGLGFYPPDHQFVLDYPKRVYTDEDHYRSLRELNFSRRELIHVERK